MKLISNQINPHFTLSDSLHAVLSLLFGPGHKKLDPFFKQKFLPAAGRGDSKNIIFTNTARSALGLICDAVRPDPSKKIGIPAFVCAVVATPFLARGYQIEWIDTDENGLMDVKDFERKAKNIGLVVVPHIFGQPAPLKKVVAVARAHDIFVVEDGAHLIRQFTWSLESGLSKVRTRARKDHQIADAQILSFGREKVVSCVSGGALLWPQNSAYATHFEAASACLKPPALGWTIRHALQPLIFSLSLPWWQWGGKVIPWLARKLKLLPLAVTAAEKHGQEDLPITRLSVVQKRILARQLRQLDQREIHAQAIALAWREALKTRLPEAQITIPPLAFRTLAVFPAPHHKEDWLWKLKERAPGLHLDDWTGVPISPKGIDYQRFGYRPGQCPQAEYFARTYLTFPTNIRLNKTDIKRVAQSLSNT